MPTANKRQGGPWTLLLLFFGLGASCPWACSNGGSPSEDRTDARRDLAADNRVPTSDQRSADAEGVVDETVDDGPQYLTSCQSLGSACSGSTDPNCGACQYRIRYRASACSKDRPCDDLFLYWAAMDCSSNALTRALDQVLDSGGFVTACVQPLYPGEVLPSSLGAPAREEAVLAQLFEQLKSDDALGIWSGKNLLMGGCSYGATRYPVVAARYSADDGWRGSVKTAACLSDGVVSVSYQDHFIGEKIDGLNNSCAGRHKRVAEAYTVAQALPGVHTCAGSPRGQCACDPQHAWLRYPEACGGGDCVAFDSIIVPQGTGFAFNQGITAADFAVEHWKLISEGGSYADTDQRCELDIVPRGPFQALCDALDAAPDKSCTFIARPEDPHCSYYTRNLTSLCVDWFRAL